MIFRGLICEESGLLKDVYVVFCEVTIVLETLFAVLEIEEKGKERAVSDGDGEGPTRKSTGFLVLNDIG